MLGARAGWPLALLSLGCQELGCQEAPAPWAGPSARAVEGVPWLAVDAGVSPPASGSAAPVASPRGAVGSPRCDDGFHSSGEPRHDAARLGLMCGPPAGMSRAQEDLEGVIVAGGAELSVPVALEAGGCLLVVASGEASLERLAVELRSERDVALASAEGGSHVLLGAAGATCSSRAEQATLRFRAVSGRGRFAAEVWSRRREQLAGEADPPSIDGARPED